MASTPPTAVPQPALSPPQLKASLWTDGRQGVYAVAMGSRIPDLPALLAGADVDDFDCLLPGALIPQAQQSAAYLVRLRQTSAFTDWLLFELAAALGEWGVLLLSPARMLSLRGHLRGLSHAQIPGGQTMTLDWMDPTLLQALLPLFDGAGLASFMGPVQSVVIPQATAWIQASVALGRLDLRRTPVLKAA